MKKIVFMALAISMFQGGLVLGTVPDSKKLTDAEKAKLQELTKDSAPGKAAQARRFLHQNEQNKLNRNEVEQFLRPYMQIVTTADDKTEDALPPSYNKAVYGSETLPPPPPPSYDEVVATAMPSVQEELAITAARKMGWSPLQYNYFRVLLGVVIKSPTYSHLHNTAQETLGLLSVGTEATEEYETALKSIENVISTPIHEYIKKDVSDKMTASGGYWPEEWIKSGIDFYLKNAVREEQELKRLRDEEEQLTREFLEREEQEEKDAALARQLAQNEERRVRQEEEDAAFARRLEQDERRGRSGTAAGAHEGVSQDELDMLRAAGISDEEIQQGRSQSAAVASGRQAEERHIEEERPADVGVLPRPFTDKDEWALMLGLEDDRFSEDANRLLEQNEIRTEADEELLQRICKEMKVL